MAADHLPFHPRTPREALLMILFAKKTVEGYTESPKFDLIATIANEGLTPRDVQSFEYTDLLTERLAEAHKWMLEKGVTPPPLPPDIEAAVERHLTVGGFR